MSKQGTLYALNGDPQTIFLTIWFSTILKWFNTFSSLCVQIVLMFVTIHDDTKRPAQSRPFFRRQIALERVFQHIKQMNRI